MRFDVDGKYQSKAAFFCVKREFIGKFLQVGIDKRLQDVLSYSKYQMVLQTGV
jgi:hypothetical protein